MKKIRIKNQLLEHQLKVAKVVELGDLTCLNNIKNTVLQLYLHEIKKTS